MGLLAAIAILKTIATASPAVYLMLYGLVVIVGILAVFSFFRGGTAKPVREQLAERGVSEMLDLAGIRIALSGRAFATIRAAIRDARGTANVHEVHSVLTTLLAHEDAWVFTSLESTPRRPLAQLAPAARRLIEDALRRFPSNAAAAPTHDSFRATNSRPDSVFVVSLVFTSRANISDHKGESLLDTKALLQELDTLAGQVHTLDVFVSDPLSIDELAQRDPAMRGIA